MLTGDINRTQSIEVWNTIAYRSYNEFEFLTPGSGEGFYQNFVEQLEDGVYTLGGTFRGSTITWGAGDRYPAYPPDGPDQQGIFGKQICLMDNYNAVQSDYSNPAFGLGQQGMSIISSDGPGGPGNTLPERSSLYTTNLAAKSIAPGEDFQVIPINLIASPLNIAKIKKALYRARELLPDSQVTFQTNSETWAEDYVTRLDLGIKDDSLSVNANIPAGYSDPSLSAHIVACPNPFVVTQGYKHGYNPSVVTNVIQPTVKPEGWNGSYQEVNTSPGPYNSAGAYFNGLMRLVKDGKQDIQQKNSIYCRTFWSEDCDPKNGKIDLPLESQFQFRNGDGKMPDYTKYFKPGGTVDSPENTKWQDGNEKGLDEGVGLCVVYLKKDYCVEDTNLEQENSVSGFNKFYTSIPFPSLRTFLPGIAVNDPNRERVPFLALVVPKLTAENNRRGLAYNQRIVPSPMIGEIFGFSSSFSDGKYAKIISTQRVNPKFYETVNTEIGQANTKFKPQSYVFDSQYYNIHDYYPYIHVGAIDPQIQFSSTSGRFEMSRLHTPATSSNGAWQAPPSAGSSGQSSDEIILMNSKRSFVSHISASANLKGFTSGRLSTISDIQSGSIDDINGVWRTTPSYDIIANKLNIIPWGEIHQDTVRQKTISSQSGIGLLNYTYYTLSSDNTLIPSFVNAYQPQLFNETMFAKLGFSIEQLMPFAGKQNSNFNRSNYNKSLGLTQPLLEKQNNMVSPFTTNGYSTAEQSFSTVTNSWVGYDTCFNVNGQTDKEGTDASAEPPGTNFFSFYETSTVPANVAGRPRITLRTDSADNSTTNLKQLPANAALTMFSLGGNNFATESVATVDSDSLIANNLPSKFNYSYLVIYSDIVGQSSNFITGSNLQITTPAIGYMTRNYSSADFMYSFDSDFNYTADRSFLLNNFNVEIRQPNGRLASIENNSTIIFKIVKNIRPILPVPKPIMKQLIAEDKEEQKEMKLTIKEFV